MPREWRERFPDHRLKRKPLVSYPGMHYGMCITHAPWCLSGSLTRRENVPGIPGACATRNFAYLVRSPWIRMIWFDCSVCWWIVDKREASVYPSLNCLCTYLGLNLPFIFNTLSPRQNGRHFANDILKCIFLNENIWIPIKISLKFVPKGPINNIPALV